jgi:hypothetical protein
LPPRLGRLLVEPMADEDKQLGRLADHLVDEVHQRDDHEQDRHDGSDPNHRVRPRESLSRPPRAAPPAAKAREEATGFCGHVFWERGLAAVGGLARTKPKRYPGFHLESRYACSADPTVMRPASVTMSGTPDSFSGNLYEHFSLRQV